jgi:hypothetical protein
LIPQNRLIFSGFDVIGGFAVCPETFHLLPFCIVQIALFSGFSALPESAFLFDKYRHSPLGQGLTGNGASVHIPTLTGVHSPSVDDFWLV